jgi:uncharacterized membrane protein YeaQ/YmgE (transglycosylase-associated protein family)
MRMIYWRSSTMTIISFVLFLFVAAACAWIASAVVPGQVPGGFFAAAIVGIIGAWLGAGLMGDVGPSLEGVPLLPAIVGSAILVFGFTVLSRNMPRKA